MLPAIDDRLIDDAPTTIVPHVVPPSRARAYAPWVGFGIVAVVVVAATSVWASMLREPPRVETVTAAPPVAVLTPSVLAPSALQRPAPPAPTPKATPVRVAAVVTAARKRSVPPAVRKPVVRTPVVATTTLVAPTRTVTPTTRARLFDDYGDDAAFGSGLTPAN